MSQGLRHGCALGSAVSLVLSWESGVFGLHALWNSLPAPPASNFPLRNSLMRLSRESISWKGLKANLRSLPIQHFSRLCAPISFPPFSRHSSSDDFRRPVCSSTSQERALDAEVLTAGRPWKKSFLDILGQKSAPFFLKVKPLCRLRTTSDSNTMSALWIIRIT